MRNLDRLQLGRRTAWVVLAPLLLFVIGCGKGDDSGAATDAGPPDAMGGEVAPGPDPGAPPVDDMAPPVDDMAPPPDMAEMPPGGGPDMMPGAPGEAAPAPTAGAGGETQVAVAPPYPARSNNPFGALDGPEQPEPPPAILPPPPSSQQLMPIRATVEVNLPRPDDGGTGIGGTLPGVRTSGILWGPTVKAIVQYRDADGAEQNAVVKPGDILPIRSPGGTSLKVQSIGPEGVQLQNERTGRVYSAPLEGR